MPPKSRPSPASPAAATTETPGAEGRAARARAPKAGAPKLPAAEAPASQDAKGRTIRNRADTATAEDTATKTRAKAPPKPHAPPSGAEAPAARGSEARAATAQDTKAGTRARAAKADIAGAAPSEAPPRGPVVSLHMLMNDSAPALLDWALHHRAVGIARITVHDDGATAQSTALGHALEAAGLIAFRPTRRPGLVHHHARQIAAMEEALAEAQADGSDYLLWLQPDDLLFVDCGAGRIPDLMTGLARTPDLVSLTSQVAGGDGQARHADAPAVARFRRGTGNAQGSMAVSTPLRTLFRPHLARALKAARPNLKPKFARGKEPVLWLNGAGEDVTETYLQRGWMANPDRPGLGLAHVVSYMAQDRESFLLRRVGVGVATGTGTGTGEALPFITPDHLRTTVQHYQRLNFAMSPTGPDDAGVGAALARRDAFLERHPQAAAAHRAAVAEFAGRLERLLARQDTRARAVIATYLQGGAIAPAQFDWPTPFGVATTPPALSEMDSAWAERLTRPEEAAPPEEDWASDEDWTEADAPAQGTGSGTATAPAAAPSAEGPAIGAPAWLSDLRLSGQAHGFYHSMPNYACTYVARSREHLLVSFDNLASVREHPVSREPWGYRFIRKEGWSHLGVLSYVPGWFRDGGLHAYLTSLRDSGFFAQFDQVTMFGTSMGGYGAAAFASLAPGCRVAAFSPQSSLSPRLASWDPRYPSGKRADWTGEFTDAAQSSAAAAQVWLFYDPAVALDRRHVERFQAPNAIPMPLRHADHKTALMLRNGGVLSTVMRDIATGRATRAGLLRHYRACRMLPAYQEGLRARAERRGRVPQLEAALAALRQGTTAPA